MAGAFPAPAGPDMGEAERDELANRGSVSPPAHGWTMISRHRPESVTVIGSSIAWKQAILTAHDLEGVDAQDRDDEAIRIACGQGDPAWQSWPFRGPYGPVNARESACIQMSPRLSLAGCNSRSAKGFVQPDASSCT